MINIVAYIVHVPKCELVYSHISKYIDQTSMSKYEVHFYEMTDVKK
ncbi:hypothetical protein HMI01_03420 [Halolactibacillus miurensis]|uniref:Uncharacterized protein n=1 Tax=Halolactibacillus miurensis TaxID=306541 RepID=A0A1I6QI16_9BACI|nr:hypothetical protein HMI01_03420 [Halolactibacillus miurensis]SFS52064.1 hypothetical protein SAMN05421668_104167 [Halolactibacillus miurensis]